MRHLIALCGLSLWSLIGQAGPLEAAREAELDNLLIQDCGSCHGSRLSGGLGPALLPDRLEGKSRAMLAQVIRDGRAGTAMPPWGPLLSDADIAWLVNRLLAGKE